MHRNRVPIQVISDQGSNREYSFQEHERKPRENAQTYHTNQSFHQNNPNSNSNSSISSQGNQMQTNQVQANQVQNNSNDNIFNPRNSSFSSQSIRSMHSQRINTPA